MAKKPEKIKREYKRMSSEIKQEILIIFLFAFSLISILGIFGLAGKAGDGLAHFLNSIFGYTSLIFLAILIVLAYLFINPEKYPLKMLNFVGLFLFIATLASLFDLVIEDGGGRLGYYISHPLMEAFGAPASFIFLTALFFISILIIFETSLNKFINFLKIVIEKIKYILLELKFKLKHFRNKDTAEDFDEFSVRSLEMGKADEEKEAFSDKSLPREQLKIFPKEKFVPKKIDLPLDLLDDNGSQPVVSDVKVNKLIIQKTLENFGIPVEMGEINIGPTVTQYTLKPADGIKLAQITTLHNDLALALATHPIRIEAPIPGKALVGIEVPNQKVAIVKLKELFNNDEFKNRKSNLLLTLGKDVSGKTYMADLGRMPHLLIAGATGSGKTVMLNSIILSLLYQNSPQDLKFILIDPKRVELTAFEDLPHLLTPVIVKVDKTINALKWTLTEMERRFNTLFEAKKKDISSYNKESGEKMPYLVVVIDELADLMVTAAQDVEACIIRLAQMARATGIHLIMATQRPSVDVITGLIKANITNRIAFSVASIMDSRTILDFSGAEKLLGRGDMLFISPELGKPKRLQGAFVGDKETIRVADYLRGQDKPDYISEVTERAVTEANNFSSSTFDALSDDLLPQAKETVIRAGKASASLLQRRLRIGYARAARILDLLEEEGIIAPADGSKPRDILVKEEQGEINNTNDSSME